MQTAYSTITYPKYTALVSIHSTLPARPAAHYALWVAGLIGSWALVHYVP